MALEGSEYARQYRERTVTNAMQHALAMYAQEQTFGGFDPTMGMLVGVLGGPYEAEWLRGFALAAKVRYDARNRTIALRGGEA